MRVTYVHHSGFLIETAARAYLFDYVSGALPPLRAERPVVVLASHAHRDHYDPGVFALLRSRGVRQICAVLSRDIPAGRRPADVPVLRVGPGEMHELGPGTRLETLRSTDRGVAFLLTTEEGVVYHAGDLNDWTWDGEPEADNRRMRERYRREIDRLRGRRIDVACVPLDPRQEAHEADGLLYFLEAVGAAAVYPMHDWDQPAVIARFLQAHPQYAGVIRRSPGDAPGGVPGGTPDAAPGGARDDAPDDTEATEAQERGTKPCNFR